MAAFLYENSTHYILEHSVAIKFVKKAASRVQAWFFRVIISKMVQP